MQQKEQYISPLSKTLEMRLEGVIAASPQFNDPFDPEQGW